MQCIVRPWQGLSEASARPQQGLSEASARSQRPWAKPPGQAAAAQGALLHAITPPGHGSLALAMCARSPRACHPATHAPLRWALPFIPSLPDSSPALLCPVLLHPSQQVQPHGCHQLPHARPEVRLASDQRLEHTCGEQQMPRVGVFAGISTAAVLFPLQQQALASTNQQASASACSRAVAAAAGHADRQALACTAAPRCHGVSLGGVHGQQLRGEAHMD